MVNIPGIENINYYALFGSMGKYIAYTFYSVVILGIMMAAYFYFNYNLKVTLFPLFGSGTDGVFSFSKPKSNRVKWNKDKTEWRPLFPFMNKKKIEPFDQEFIYPGNRIFAFDLNGVWVPGRININKEEETLRAEINPVPYYVRNWQSLIHKQNSMEYASDNWWDQNKMMVYMLIGVGICCAMCVITIYLCLQQFQGISPELSAFTDAIKGFSNIPGAPK